MLEFLCSLNELLANLLLFVFAFFKLDVELVDFLQDGIYFRVADVFLHFIIIKFRFVKLRFPPAFLLFGLGFAESIILTPHLSWFGFFSRLSNYDSSSLFNIFHVEVFSDDFHAALIVASVVLCFGLQKFTIFEDVGMCFHHIVTVLFQSIFDVGFSNLIRNVFRS